MIEIAFTQHTGNNPSQQDALWNGEEIFQKRNLPIALRSVSDGERLVVAVTDGVASSPMPQKASHMVLDALSRTIAGGAILSTRTIRQVHGSLCDVLAKGKTFGSSTTLAAVECGDARCTVVSVGDSRVYRISANRDWQQLTRDHTILNAMIDRGEADAGTEYASFYCALDSCLVADDEETDFPVHCVEAPFLLGDAFLLCTDGVHDTLGDTKLKGLTTYPLDPAAQVAKWRKAVLNAGAPDNFSMILLHRR